MGKWDALVLVVLILTIGSCGALTNNNAKVKALAKLECQQE